MFCMAQQCRAYAGAAGVPVHWSVGSGSRAVCLRFAPHTAGSKADAPWSHPIQASFPAGVDRHVAIPVQPPQPSETAEPGTPVPQVLRRKWLHVLHSCLEFCLKSDKV